MRWSLVGRQVMTLILLGVAGVVIAACGSSSKSSSTSKSSTASQAAKVSSTATSGWTLPGANLQNTRDVSGPINSSNVSQLGVAWTAPIKATGVFGGYATTPVVVNGVVYTQDLDSNVEAIQLSTGKVLWTMPYNSPNEGPDGVNVAHGTVFATTATSAVAIQAATGEQLWSTKLIRNNHEGIDMAPGYNNGTVYVSTVPGNATAFYAGNGQATLWALNATTGKAEWKFNEVQDLWSGGNQKLVNINSGGGQWDPPSFDSQGNVYIGVANPAPFGGVPGYPWGSSRPGPDLYTDSVVKLSPQGKLLWYYQLTPHDLHDWDINNSPVLSTANGQPVVIDAGKAGIVIELNADTGKLLWKDPVGVHNGHDNDGLITENMTPAQAAKSSLGKVDTVEPGELGGVESQLASNGTTTFAAINDLATPIYATGQAVPKTPAAAAAFFKGYLALVAKATGEVVAINQDTGQIEWDTKLPSSAYGAATVSNDVLFTTTYNGHLYALSTKTGQVLLNKPMSAFTNAPVAIDGDYVITAAGFPLSKTQVPLIIAYKLGGTSTLPDTVP
jgi:alcohol dehydrogenase (cytochrome c)